MNENEPQSITPEALPDVVHHYLDAHRVHDTAAAIATFSGDATVVDDGRTHRGRAAIEAWLDRSATEYTYTIETTGAQRIGDTRYMAMQHLEGNFPGGVADLRYQFTLQGGLITDLVIEP